MTVMIRSPLTVPLSDSSDTLALGLKRTALSLSHVHPIFSKAVALIERELKSGAPNGEKIKGEILCNRRSDFIVLQKKIRDLLKTRDMRDYYKLIGGLLKLRGGAGFVSVIESQDDPGRVSTLKLSLRIAQEYHFT